MPYVTKHADGLVNAAADIMTDPLHHDDEYEEVLFELRELEALLSLVEQTIEQQRAVDQRAARMSFNAT